MNAEDTIYLVLVRKSTVPGFYQVIDRPRSELAALECAWEFIDEHPDYRGKIVIAKVTTTITCPLKDK